MASQHAEDDPVIAWLLASDPSIAWQVKRDLLSLPPAEYGKTRALVRTTGFGAALLSHQDPDGQWGGAAFAPVDVPAAEWKSVGQPWTATAYALEQLCEFGLDPDSEVARRTVQLVGENSRWDEGGQKFWDGETEECINGRTVATGTYFGVDMEKLVARLLGERQEDGGWNCERCNGSKKSSFATTINVLEGLAQWERAKEPGEVEEVRKARKAGEEYLLKRKLFRRARDGQVADERFVEFLHPNRWRYDILRALDYFREVGGWSGEKPDERLAEAVELVRQKRRPDGKWALDWALPGREWIKVNDGPGEPSPWITLRVLRVLKWWSEWQEKKDESGQ